MFFFFSSRRRHTRYWRDWSSDVCSSDLPPARLGAGGRPPARVRRVGSWEALRVRRMATDTKQYRKRSRTRSEERRVGEECRSWWSPYHLKKKKIRIKKRRYIL